MDNEEAAQRAMMQVASGSTDWPPLDHVLDGPALRVFFAPLPVAMRLGRKDGRTICTGILIGWTDEREEITSRDVRLVKVQEYLHEIARRGQARLPERPARERGNLAYTSDELAAYAELYREALAVQPGTPVKYMRERTGYSDSTIHRLIQRCRERGLLSG